MVVRTRVSSGGSVEGCCGFLIWQVDTCSIFPFSIRIHVHYVNWIHEIANSSMYPSYSLDLDLVCEALESTGNTP